MMGLYFSKSTCGFYDDDISGARKLLVPDPSFVPSPSEDGDVATAPLIEVDNPDCKIPSDAVAITVEMHQALLIAESAGKILQVDENGFPVVVDPLPPTADEIRAQWEAAAQKMLDDFAKTWGYDSIRSCISYRGDPNAKYNAEAETMFAWRSAVWTKSETIDVAVRAGGVPPADVDAYLAELPAPPTRPVVS